MTATPAMAAPDYWYTHNTSLYDAVMRTTVDLPPAVHSQIKRLAEERKTSISSLVADLTRRGLEQLEPETPLEIDPETNLPVMHVGHRVTAADVDAFLADSE